MEIPMGMGMRWVWEQKVLDSAVGMEIPTGMVWGQIFHPHGSPVS